ncbi:hypothetical protein MiSe_30900 [Microseira wollei NIES-4236]|uniref:HTH araC/xylS-type domain-containing protein n=1 Tax=Microseira wollei NIES-4236 TaxID=2530354 RepID=A0AAV3WHF2_9CYAN|nr:hypothetical protein MiSe_30900 [Microseira wollei NIES-4236]
MTCLMILERLSLNQTSYASGTEYIVRTYAKKTGFSEKSSPKETGDMPPFRTRVRSNQQR